MKCQQKSTKWGLFVSQLRWWERTPNVMANSEGQDWIFQARDWSSRARPAIYPEGPRIEKIHSRSNAWKNHSPTHEIFSFSLEIFIPRFENFILDWKKIQSRALFFCGQRGARNGNFILDWNFHSVLKAWFFQILPLEIEFFQSWGPLGTGVSRGPTGRKPRKSLPKSLPGPSGRESEKADRSCDLLRLLQGSFGPFGPKVQKESEKGSRGREAPGTLFGLFLDFGPEGPKWPL